LHPVELQHKHQTIDFTGRSCKLKSAYSLLHTKGSGGITEELPELLLFPATARLYRVEIQPKQALPARFFGKLKTFYPL
jgi:hypothetical protein